MNGNRLTVLDVLFDERASNVIKLKNKEKAISLKQVYATTIGDYAYAILVPLSPVVGLSEEEALVFRVEKNMRLSVVTDEEITRTIFTEYYQALGSEV